MIAAVLRPLELKVIERVCEGAKEEEVPGRVRDDFMYFAREAPCLSRVVLVRTGYGVQVGHGHRASYGSATDMKTSCACGFSSAGGCRLPC